jgi:hypothetical protein
LGSDKKFSYERCIGCAKKKVAPAQAWKLRLYCLLFYLDKLSATFCVRKVPTTESITDPSHRENFLEPDAKAVQKIKIQFEPASYIEAKGSKTYLIHYPYVYCGCKALLLVIFQDYSFFSCLTFLELSTH